MASTDAHPARPLYRIRFNTPSDMRDVEDTLLLAILAVGCLHGEAAVRLEAGYAIDADDRLVVLDAGGPLALAVARVFVGMCSHSLGEGSFRVLRGENKAARGRAAAA